MKNYDGPIKKLEREIERVRRKNQKLIEKEHGIFKREVDIYIDFISEKYPNYRTDILMRDEADAPYVSLISVTVGLDPSRTSFESHITFWFQRDGILHVFTNAAGGKGGRKDYHVRGKQKIKALIVELIRYANAEIKKMPK